MKVGIIGGSGVYDAELFQTTADKITTPYGEVEFERGVFGGEEIFFLPRHGKGHSVPPHLINYRANIAAFKMLGVERIPGHFCGGIFTSGTGPGNVCHPQSVSGLYQTPSPSLR